jgi:hypothetical protein
MTGRDGIVERHVAKLTAATALMLVISFGSQAQTAPGKPVAKPDPKSSHRDIRVLARNLAAEVRAPLTPAELEVASKVHVGTLPCELGQVVVLVPEPASPGYFSLRMGRTSYRVSPEETSTGAIRLEDKAAGIVWLQLTNKSMLMSQKLGRRLADECQSPLQAQVAQAMRVNPPPSILDAVSKADAPKAIVD